MRLGASLMRQAYFWRTGPKIDPQGPRDFPVERPNTGDSDVVMWKQPDRMALEDVVIGRRRFLIKRLVGALEGSLRSFSFRSGSRPPPTSSSPFVIAPSGSVRPSRPSHPREASRASPRESNRKRSIISRRGSALSTEAESPKRRMCHGRSSEMMQTQNAMQSHNV